MLFYAQVILIVCFASCNESKNKDVQLLSQDKIDSINKAVSEEISGMTSAKSEGINKIDSAKVKELEKYFTFEEDEFDVNKRKWIKPKSAARYANQNSVYLYFSADEKGPDVLRLRFQYCANDWLFIKKYIFNIDGFPIEFTPGEVKRDNQAYQIWEWSDDPMTGFETNLVEAIESCESIKVKIIGSDYEEVKTISNKEIDAMKKSIELYKAMGGII